MILEGVSLRSREVSGFALKGSLALRARGEFHFVQVESLNFEL